MDSSRKFDIRDATLLKILSEVNQENGIWNNSCTEYSIVPQQTIPVAHRSPCNLCSRRFNRVRFRLLRGDHFYDYVNVKRIDIIRNV